MNDSIPPSDARHDPAGDDTCEALLAAGRALFAQRGYDGASIRAITGAAGANLGAVTYHFGSKENLYHEVLRRAVTPLREQVEEALRRPGPAVDRLVSVVETYFEYFSRNPDLPRFLLQEVAAGRVPPPPVTDTMKAVSGRVAEVVREGQTRGQIRDGHPLLMVLSLIAQPLYLVLMQRPLREVLGMDLNAPDTRAQVLGHIRAFARAGIAGESP